MCYRQIIGILSHHTIKITLLSILIQIIDHNHKPDKVFTTDCNLDNKTIMSRFLTTALEPPMHYKNKPYRRTNRFICITDRQKKILI